MSIGDPPPIRKARAMAPTVKSTRTVRIRDAQVHGACGGRARESSDRVDDVERAPGAANAPDAPLGASATRSQRVPRSRSGALTTCSSARSAVAVSRVGALVEHVVGRLGDEPRLPRPSSVTLASSAGNRENAK